MTFAGVAGTSATACEPAAFSRVGVCEREPGGLVF